MKTARSLILMLGFSRIVLIILGLTLLGYASQNQIQHGWFARGDILPFLAGSLALFMTLFPRVIRVNLVILVLLIMMLELLARIFTSGGPQEKVTVKDLNGNSQSLYTELRMEQYGYEMEADIKRVVTDTVDNEIIYESTVTTDMLGRRITPGIEGKRSEGFLAFFGDSFTFGDGVDDNETLPYYVSNLLPEYLVYNYGVSGYGPQHTLARIDGSDLHEEIDASKGIGIYLYIDGHVDRAAYGMRSGWVQRSPYYEWTENDEVIRKGNFHTTNPITYSLYQDLFLKSALLSLLGVNLPYIGTDDILFTCRILAEAKQEFKKQFPVSSFFVVFYPGQNKYSPDLKECFDERGVKYLDYSEMFWPEKFRIPFDGHPNSDGHRYFAELIAPKLKSSMDSLLR